MTNFAILFHMGLRRYTKLTPELLPESLDTLLMVLYNSAPYLSVGPGPAQATC